MIFEPDRFTGRRARNFIGWPVTIALVIASSGVILATVSMVYPQRVPGLGLLLLGGQLGQVVSPIAGIADDWSVEEGDDIARGQVLLSVRELNDDQSTRSIIADQDGVVAEITAYPGTVVKKGQTLAIITKSGDLRTELEVLGFVSSLEGKKIVPGMRAQIKPSIVDPLIHGHLLGVVKRVGKLPMSKSAVGSVVKIPEVAKYIRHRLAAEPFAVAISLLPNRDHQSGYLWEGPGFDGELDSGIIVDFFITHRQPTLLSLMWPSMWRWREKEP